MVQKVIKSPYDEGGDGCCNRWSWLSVPPVCPFPSCFDSRILIHLFSATHSFPEHGVEVAQGWGKK